MSTSINRKSAVDFTVKASRKGLLKRTRWVALSVALAFVHFPAAALAQSSSCPSIQVKVLNISNSVGTIGCALFESAEGFPLEYLRYANNIIVIKIRDTQARCVFVDIPPGRYALAVIHDENMNGKLDTNWMGIPTEGYGFSNDAKAILGSPSFSAAGFYYDGGTLDLTITLHY